MYYYNNKKRLSEYHLCCLVTRIRAASGILGNVMSSRLDGQLSCTGTSPIFRSIYYTGTNNGVCTFVCLGGWVGVARARVCVYCTHVCIHSAWVFFCLGVFISVMFVCLPRKVPINKPPSLNPPTPQRRL